LIFSLPLNEVIADRLEALKADGIRESRHLEYKETLPGAIEVEYVFHRRGNVIKEYYGAWRSACKRAGVSGRLVHDFRRTAVDRLEWSGVPRAVAMKLTGHETDAVYSRYHIARGKDLRAGVARVADYIEALNGSGKESGKEAATAIRVHKVGPRK
jgi:integrase